MDHITLTEELQQTLESFMEYLRLERNASPLTLTTYRPAIKSYMESALELASDEWSPSDADRDLVRNWIMQQMDDELTSTTVNKNLSAVKSFYKYLQLRGLIDSNPTRYLRGPKREHTLPSFLTQAQIEEALETISTDPKDFLAVRNRLIIETIYQTGLRRAEVASLETQQVDLKSMSLRVVGKGRKERIVPFGEALKKQMDAYLTLKKRKVGQSRYFFVTLKCRPLSGADVYQVVHKALDAVPGLPRRGAHTLRHSFATEMLNAGAPITSIKELLGHSNLDTTTRYTHTSFEQLKQLYHAHPRAQSSVSPMINVHIQSLQFDASEALQEFAKKKIDRLARFDDTISKAEVTLRLDKSNATQGKIAAIRLIVPGYDHYAEKGAASFEEAIDEAIDALKRQIDRAKANK
ncbi:ribosome hibernation-promoting factor, HPF/YfiA family [uncultured Porphyromonas sp.]|uniref:ribosome hibernation-promoting factor, HPF/YfiA family n=1 Tax=uncultured Porphyromonas sp. TaxID=159274 RepID=UPI002614B74E|nr:ribosome-associated translation inhibitor RaiA [uncultured Porphyromonas sp.]